LDGFKKAKDIYPMGRARSASNNFLRSLKSKHVQVVDYERSLENTFLEEGIGCNLFGNRNYCDQFHPNKIAHQHLADLLYDQVFKGSEATESQSANIFNWHTDYPLMMINDYV